MKYNIVVFLVHRVLTVTGAVNGIFRYKRRVISGCLAITVFSCTTVTIRDSEWCGVPPYTNPMIGFDAACYHTLVTDHRDLDPQAFKAWLSDAVEPKVCTTISTFADWKSAQEKLCSLTHACVYQDAKPSERKAQ